MNTEDKLRRALETATAQLKNIHGQIGGDELARDIKTCDEALAATQEQRGEWQEERERLKASIDFRLNECLCEMKDGYDDSIVGFNEAWDVVAKVFELASLPSAPSTLSSSERDAQS